MCSENAAKARIALVKAHGLQLLKSLQSRAKQTLSSMQKWTEEQYFAETKRYGLRVRVDSCVQYYGLLVYIEKYEHSGCVNFF